MLSQSRQAATSSTIAAAPLLGKMCVGRTCFLAALAGWHKARVDLAAAQQLINGVKLGSCGAPVQGISIVVTHNDERRAYSAAELQLTGEPQRQQQHKVPLEPSCSSAPIATSCRRVQMCTPPPLPHCTATCLAVHDGRLTDEPARDETGVVTQVCCSSAMYHPGPPGAMPPAAPASSCR